MRKITYKLPVILECQYLTGDRQVRIYLRPAPVKRYLSLRAKRRIRKVFRFLLLLLVTVSIMFPVSIYILEAVYISRGYWAVGGEFLFLGLMAFGIFKGVNRIF